MAVLPDGSIGLLGINVDLAGAWARLRRQETEPLAAELLELPYQLAARGLARLWRYDGTTLHDGPTVPLESPSLALAGFADGRWLIANTRENDEPNGRLLTPDGALLERLHLGDAIAHLDVDLADRVWVGWFDEGIFGNIDRFSADFDRTAEVAACFTADGAMLPVGPVPKEAGFLADAYAMTVTENGAWVCPYTEFPLLHLRPGQPVRWWRNKLPEVSAIATDGRHALLAGGYNDNSARLTLVELSGDGRGEQVRILASWSLPIFERVPQEHEHPPLAEQRVWGRPTLLAGRGDMLHLVSEGVWYSWRIGHAVEDLGRT